MLAKRLKLVTFALLASGLMAGCEQRRSSSVAAPPKDNRLFSISYRGKFPLVTRPEEMDVYEAVIHHNQPLENRVQVSRFVHRDEELGEMKPGDQDFVDPAVGTEFPAVYTLVEKDAEGTELRRVKLTLSIPDGLYLDGLYRGDTKYPMNVGRLILTEKATISAPARGFEIRAHEIQAAKGARLLNDHVLEDGEAPGLLRVRADSATGDLTVDPSLRVFSPEEIEKLSKEEELDARVLDSGTQPVDIRVEKGKAFSVNLVMPEVSQASKLQAVRAALLRHARFDREGESFVSCGGKLFPRSKVSGIYERLDPTEPGPQYLWFSPRGGTPVGFSPGERDFVALPVIFQSMNSYPCNRTGELSGLMSALMLFDPMPKLYPWRRIEAGELLKHGKPIQNLALLIESVHALDRVLDPLGCAAEVLGEATSNFRNISFRQVEIANAFATSPETVANFLRKRQLQDISFDGGLMDHFMQLKTTLIVPAGLTESAARILELMKSENLPVRLLGELYR